MTEYTEQIILVIGSIILCIVGWVLRAFGIPEDERPLKKTALSTFLRVCWWLFILSALAWGVWVIFFLYGSRPRDGG